jgi:trehalose 6-phosphate synthase/phosphatase
MDINTESEIKEKFRNAKNRLVLLDYDGTLVKHTPLPETAILPEHMSDIIIKLVDNPQTKIFIITGRGRSDIDKFLDHIPINIIAEHGAMVKMEGVWKNQIINNLSWKKAIMPVLNQITATCPESYIEEKNFSLTWHYRNADPDLGYSSSRELIRLLQERIHSYNLRILDGNKVVEILTNETGKGTAVKKLFEQNTYDFVLSIGDDATDEEMFEFFLNYSNAITIKVGEGTTFAGYKLESIKEVASLLKKLSE